MKYISLLVLFFCVFNLSANILMDDFDDGNRLLQDPPSSLAYYTSHESSSMREADGMLTLGGGGGNNRILTAYFGKPGDYTELKVGEAISLQLTFSAEIAERKSGRHLRLGLFESGDQRGDRRAVNADGFRSDVPGHGYYRGYQVAMGFVKGGGQVAWIAKRALYGTDLLILALGDASAYQPMGSGGGKEFEEIKSGAIYTAQLNIERVSDREVKVSGILAAGDPQSAGETDYFYHTIDTDDPVFKFDTLAIGLNAADGSVSRLDMRSLRVFTVQNR